MMKDKQNTIVDNFNFNVNKFIKYSFLKGNIKNKAK